MKLIPIKYRNKEYPNGIIASLIEVAGNFDSSKIVVHQPYSLHTEYSYVKRSFSGDIFDGLDELRDSHVGGIPLLWRSTKWACEFAVFISRLVCESVPPSIIEIHPPYRDYCGSYEQFWERYIVFYKQISKLYPNVKILIENRCGTPYSKSAFLISNCEDIIEFCEFLKNKNDELGIVLDYPQLFSAERINLNNIKLDKILLFNRVISSYKNSIKSIHLWGKKKSSKTGRWCAHSGDLNSFFSNNQHYKKLFLQSICNTFNDDEERYFVPEVNTTNEDLFNIINDMISNGVVFVDGSYTTYLMDILWVEDVPYFVLYNRITKQTERIKCIGKKSIALGHRRYCVGYKEIESNDYVTCSKSLEITDGSKVCASCKESNAFRSCIGCRGDKCSTKNKHLTQRCNQNHYVYLAYFSGNLIKVGVAHNKRKYVRLYEQGAILGMYIAVCSNGKIARQVENSIKELGIVDKVSKRYKFCHLSYFDIATAYNKLFDTFNYISNNLHIQDSVYLNSQPEVFCQHSTLELLKTISFQPSSQLSIFDEPDEVYELSAEKMTSINVFKGEIIDMIGTIALMFANGKYYIYDMNDAIGNDMDIS